VNRSIRDTAQRWLAEARAAIVVEVTQALGSAPREAGTRMLVSGNEAIGTVGGGHLELKAISHAREMLRTRECAPHTEHFPLGPALGQCCGGAVTLAYRGLDAAALASWPEPAPLFHLQLYGAGHVGRAIATLLATLDVSVDWIDEREAEFPATTSLGTPWPAHIRRVCVDAVEAEVRLAKPGAFYLVLTHDHDLDLRITEAVMRRGDFAYLGLIGSKTKRQRFVHRFQQRGVDPETIDRMTCPIGVQPSIGKEPEVIALGVVAQLLQRLGLLASAAATAAPPARTASATTT
jgi:xanthine dehydrogenase accessory factor